MWGVMDSRVENMRADARRCRALADSIRYDETAEMLNRLGDEFDLAAAKLSQIGSCAETEAHGQSR